MRAFTRRWLVPGCGISSVITFAVHATLHGSAPGTDSPSGELVAFGTRHYSALLASAWLDGVAVALLLVFVAGAVRQAHVSREMAATITLIGIGLSAAVILANDIFLITFGQAARHGNGAVAATAQYLVNAANMVLPLPDLVWVTGLAAILHRTRLVPRTLARLGLVLGLAEAVIGPIAVATSTAPNNGWYAATALWIVSVATAVGVCGPRFAGHPGAPGPKSDPRCPFPAEIDPESPGPGRPQLAATPCQTHAHPPSAE